MNRWVPNNLYNPHPPHPTQWPWCFTESLQAHLTSETSSHVSTSPTWLWTDTLVGPLLRLGRSLPCEIITQPATVFALLPWTAASWDQGLVHLPCPMTCTVPSQGRSPVNVRSPALQSSKEPPALCTCHPFSFK